VSELTLIDRLRHFEKNQLEQGDAYGAEVLHRAAEELAAAERRLASAEAEAIHYKDMFFMCRQDNTDLAVEEHSKWLAAQDD